MSPGGRAPLLHAISDRRRLAPAARTLAEEIRALDAWLDAVLVSGIDVLQLRERDLDTARLVALARRAVHAGAGGAVRVLVNDRVDVALASAAGGVHLPGRGLPPARVRPLAPAGWLIGRSAHDEAAVRGAGPVDYLYFGTVFPSASKPALPAAAGLTALAAAVTVAPVPVLAIGGITAANARACVDAGAAGVAAIGWFVPSQHGESAADELARRVAAIRRAMSPER